jgi:hypothetical protein
VSPEHSATDFYVTGGAMPPRRRKLCRSLRGRRAVSGRGKGRILLCAHHDADGEVEPHGRTAQRLAAAGVRSAQITLETIRESSAAPSPDQFLYGIANRIHRALGLTTPLADWWRERDLLSATNRFHEFLTELLL